MSTWKQLTNQNKIMFLHKNKKKNMIIMGKKVFKMTLWISAKFQEEIKL